MSRIPPVAAAGASGGRWERHGIPLPYFRRRSGATGKWPEVLKKPIGVRRCYHHIEMKPHSIGRTLGIGLRVAGRIAGQRVKAGAEAAAAQADASAPPSSAPLPPNVDAAAKGRSAGQAAVRGTKGLARGVGGFLRPFRRVGGILWLEVTGAFFFRLVRSLRQPFCRRGGSWR